MSRNTTIGIVAVVLLALLGWFFIKSQQSSSPAVQTAPSPQVAQPSDISASSVSAIPAGENVVMISDKGFSPQSITLKKGESVTWKNIDTAGHTVNSAPHPVHTVYPPLNLNLIKPGEEKSLTFPAAGTYKYHDHLNPSLFGSVTVQ